MPTGPGDAAPIYSEGFGLGAASGFAEGGRCRVFWLVEGCCSRWSPCERSQLQLVPVTEQAYGNSEL